MPIVGLRTSKHRFAPRVDENIAEFGELFGSPSSTCETFLMLSELALQDVATAESAALALELLDVQKLLASALGQLGQDHRVKTTRFGETHETGSDNGRLMGARWNEHDNSRASISMRQLP